MITYRLPKSYCCLLSVEQSGGPAASLWLLSTKFHRKLLVERGGAIQAGLHQICFVLYSKQFKVKLSCRARRLKYFKTRKMYVYYLSFVLSLMCYVLCVMCYMLCVMCHVICVMCDVLCLMCYVLCVMCYVLCLMSYVLCVMCYVFCLMSYVLSQMSYVLCLM